MKLNVEKIYEDEFLVALNKPYGMIVNNADTSRHLFTLQDWVRENLSIDATKSPRESDFFQRDGLVHRLDKETSGVILVAKNEQVFILLQRAFKERKVEKSYLALVHGKFPEEASVAVPVGRLPWNRMRFGVVPDGKEASTEFEALSFYKSPSVKDEVLTLVRAFPKTGRTHQIRVHLQYLKFPIFSDLLYAGGKQGRADRKLLERHFLHAEKITLEHPVNQKKVTFSAKLTIELEKFLDSLKKI